MPPATQPHASTLLDALRRPGPRDLRARSLFAYALLFSGFGAVLVTVAGLPQAAILTLFLSATALHGAARDLLDDNSAAIWLRGERAWAANQRTALGLVALFTAMLVVFAALAAWQASGPGVVPGGGILQRRFGANVGALLAHNLGTLAVLMLLGFVYRAYGALIALGWNAATWAGVLTTLVLQGLPQANVSPTRFVLTSGLAVLPHLMVEALGYIVGTLAAIFASRAASRYGASDPRLWRVLRALVVMVAVAISLLVLAATLERAVPARVLGTLR